MQRPEWVEAKYSADTWMVYDKNSYVPPDDEQAESGLFFRGSMKACDEWVAGVEIVFLLSRLTKLSYEMELGMQAGFERIVE